MQRTPPAAALRHVGAITTLAIAAAIASGVVGACASAPPAPPVAEPEPREVRRALEAPAPIARRDHESRPGTFRIVAGGDVIFGRYIHGVLRPVGGDAPFAHLAPLFRAADLAVLNLETPVTEVEPRVKQTRAGFLTFRAPPERVDLLVDAGLDLVVTANNHAEDCGPEGLADTLRHLADAGVAAVGTAVDGDPIGPVTVERAGLRIAVLAATSKRNRGRPRPGEQVPVAYLSLDDTLEQLPGRVEAVRDAGEHDVIVVSLHWGAGGERRVHPKQIAIARALVDAGADLVLGHHAHILQAVEAWGDGFIVYGMGNLIFDMRQRDGRETALFDLTLTPNGDRWRVERLVVHPFLIDRPTVGPRPVEGAEARALLAPMASPSRARFATPLHPDGPRLVWERPRESLEAEVRGDD